MSFGLKATEFLDSALPAPPVEKSSVESESDPIQEICFSILPHCFVDVHSTDERVVVSTLYGMKHFPIVTNNLGVTPCGKQFQHANVQSLDEPLLRSMMYHHADTRDLLAQLIIKVYHTVFSLLNVKNHVKDGLQRSLDVDQATTTLQIGMGKKFVRLSPSDMPLSRGTSAAHCHYAPSLKDSVFSHFIDELMRTRDITKLDDLLRSLCGVYFEGTEDNKRIYNEIKNSLSHVFERESPNLFDYNEFKEILRKILSDWETFYEEGIVKEKKQLANSFNSFTSILALYDFMTSLKSRLSTSVSEGAISDEDAQPILREIESALAMIENTDDFQVENAFVRSGFKIPTSIVSQESYLYLVSNITTLLPLWCNNHLDLQVEDRLRKKFIWLLNLVSNGDISVEGACDLYKTMQSEVCSEMEEVVAYSQYRFRSYQEIFSKLIFLSDNLLTSLNSRLASTSLPLFSEEELSYLLSLLSLWQDWCDKKEKDGKELELSSFKGLVNSFFPSVSFPENPSLVLREVKSVVNEAMPFSVSFPKSLGEGISCFSTLIQQQREGVCPLSLSLSGFLYPKVWKRLILIAYKNTPERSLNIDSFRKKILFVGEFFMKVFDLYQLKQRSNTFRYNLTSFELESQFLSSLTKAFEQNLPQIFLENFPIEMRGELEDLFEEFVQHYSQKVDKCHLNFNEIVLFLRDSIKDLSFADFHLKSPRMRIVLDVLSLNLLEIPRKKISLESTSELDEINDLKNYLDSPESSSEGSTDIDDQEEEESGYTCSLFGFSGGGGKDFTQINRASFTFSDVFKDFQSLFPRGPIGIECFSQMKLDQVRLENYREGSALWGDIFDEEALASDHFKDLILRRMYVIKENLLKQSVLAFSLVPASTSQLREVLDSFKLSMSSSSLESERSGILFGESYKTFIESKRELLDFLPSQCELLESLPIVSGRTNSFENDYLNLRLISILKELISEVYYGKKTCIYPVHSEFKSFFLRTVFGSDVSLVSLLELREKLKETPRKTKLKVTNDVFKKLSEFQIADKSSDVVKLFEIIKISNKERSLVGIEFFEDCLVAVYQAYCLGYTSCSKRAGMPDSREFSDWKSIFSHNLFLREGSLTLNDFCRDLLDANKSRNVEVMDRISYLGSEDIAPLLYSLPFFVRDKITKLNLIPHSRDIKSTHRRELVQSLKYIYIYHVNHNPVVSFLEKHILLTKDEIQKEIFSVRWKGSHFPKESNPFEQDSRFASLTSYSLGLLAHLLTIYDQEPIRFLRVKGAAFSRLTPEIIIRDLESLKKHSQAYVNTISQIEIEKRLLLDNFLKGLEIIKAPHRSELALVNRYLLSSKEEFYHLINRDPKITVKIGKPFSDSAEDDGTVVS